MLAVLSPRTFAHPQPHTQFENTHAYAHPNPHEPDSRTRKVVGINGSNISLADFAGNVSIVVNVATL